MPDRTSDRTDVGAKAAWAEMDAFIKECERAGPAKSDEEMVRLQRKFLEIQERCNARALAIFERAVTGHMAPHLRLVRNEDEDNAS